MSSLMQSRWAQDPAPAPAKEEPKEEEDKPQPSPSPSQPTEPTEQPPSSRRKSEQHTLSAAATAFAPSSPSAPPPDLSTYDEFAQTGGQEGDLFDDVLPVEESMQTRPPEDLFGDDFTPVAEPVVETAAPAPEPPAPVEQPTFNALLGSQHAPQPAPQSSRGRNDGSRGRGRGRGRGGRKDSQGQEQSQSREEVPASAPASAPDNAPTGPKKETTASVRGDRRGTGGVRKPKLTEAQLAEKMAQIRINDAARTAAHARAEADAASFAEREQAARALSAQKLREEKEVAARKAREERKDRQQMMGERERNRLRKLKGLEGREWDMEKTEGDFEKGGRFDKRGGFAGDKEDYSDGREYLYREPKQRQGGGGGGGGGSRGGKQSQAQAQSAPPAKEDFPSLPTKSDEAKPKTDKNASFFGDNAAAGKSWADQVESTTPTG